MNGKKGGNPRVSHDEIDVMGGIGAGNDVKINDPGISLQFEDEEIEGGLADNWTVEDIAKKHGVSVSYIEEQLEEGIQVEYEHTNDLAIAREIALDHLLESHLYYFYLKDMEAEFEH
jgi:hypothetical protein